MARLQARHSRGSGGEGARRMNNERTEMQFHRPQLRDITEVGRWTLERF